MSSTNGTIHIGKPYIETLESAVNGKAVRLCADITKINHNAASSKKSTLYFEFEERFAPYLCHERSDAFVLGLLIMAMEDNYDVEYEVPLSEKLYYQLSIYFIPMVSKYNAEKLSNIQLKGTVSDKPVENLGKVATGCSGGVDSFYTIVRHNKEHVSKSFQLTHLVFSSTGTMDNNSKRIAEYYRKQLEEVKGIAKDIGCDTIGCYSNLHEYYRYPYWGFCNFFTPVYGSVVLAIQKLVKTYFVSSGDSIEYFHLDLSKVHGHDGSVFDVYTVGCMNTENLSFYSTGVECSRIEKEDYISSDKAACKHLNVCGMEINGVEKTWKKRNCGICNKCLRTMVQLYVLGKLERFGEVFDIECFYKYKRQRIGQMIASNKISYVSETVRMAKKNHVKIGIIPYLWAWLVYKPQRNLAHLLSRVRWMRRLYYQWNLDYKIHGYRDNAKYEAIKKDLNL